MESYDHKKMIVYQKSMDLVLLLYSAVSSLPSEEKYGLRSQMTRAAVSIPSNISEGGRRKGFNEKKQFFRIAFGSASELETQLEICEKLGFIPKQIVQSLQSLLLEIIKMLNKLSY